MNTDAVFYNDNDPHVCGWLRNLIDAGHLPGGIVQGCSITEVHPMECGDTSHMFAGIGGWALALKLAGWPPSVPVWTGSCPCQPFSTAGKRKGVNDDRHLWPAFLALITECRPPIVFGEQVASQDGRDWLAGVRADLEEIGYAVGAADLCAASTGMVGDPVAKRTAKIIWRLHNHLENHGHSRFARITACAARLADRLGTGSAPHIRQRLYWVAYSNTKRLKGEQVHELQGEKGRSDVEAARCGGSGVTLADTDSPTGGRHGPEVPRAKGRSEGEGEPGRSESVRPTDGSKDPHTLGDSNGGRGNGWEQDPERRSKARVATKRTGGSDSGVDDTNRPGLQRHAGDEVTGDQPGRVQAESVGSASKAGTHSSMADTGHGNRRARDTAIEVQAGSGRNGPTDGGELGPWYGTRLVQCVQPTSGDETEIKYRRCPTQPQLYPLAFGPTGVVVVSRAGVETSQSAEGKETKRVSRKGAIKGAGNAIVPQVAALFITAFMESVGMVEVPTAKDVE